MMRPADRPATDAPRPNGATMPNRTERLADALTDLIDTLARTPARTHPDPIVRGAARGGADAARRGATFAARGNATDAAAEAGDAMTHALAVLTYTDDAERANLETTEYRDAINRVGITARRALAEAVAAYQGDTGAESGTADALRTALTYTGWIGISQAAARAGAGRTYGAITDRLPIMANAADRLANAIRHADA